MTDALRDRLGRVGLSGGLSMIKIQRCNVLFSFFVSYPAHLNVGHKILNFLFLSMFYYSNLIHLLTIPPTLLQRMIQLSNFKFYYFFLLYFTTFLHSYLTFVSTTATYTLDFFLNFLCDSIIFMNMLIFLIK